MIVTKYNLDDVKKEIGNTPISDFSFFAKNNNKILVKEEWLQLGGSIKARAAYYMIEDAIKKNEINNKTQLLDASSGNTAIAYATIAHKLGIEITIVIPKNASKERIEILENLSVNLIFSSPFEGTDGAQKEAKKLALNHPEKYFYADQYNNKNNWKAHIKSTSEEIWRQTNGKITHFIAGLGTTGTVVGNAIGLKKHNPEIKIIGLQPNSPMHGLEGWKHLDTAIVPGIYDQSLLNSTYEIDTMEAIELINKVYLKKGYLISPSAAANLLGAIKLSESVKNATIVTTFADNADKYSEVINQLNIK